MIDIERIREETPSTKYEINLDTAGGSVLPTPVVEDMVRFIKGSAELRHDPAYLTWSRAKTVGIKSNLAKLINAKPTEIALARNGSEAINAIAHSLPWQKGDNVVISNLEFHSTYTPWIRLREQKGIEVRVAKSGKELVLDPGAIEQLVDENTKLILLTHVPNSTGTIQPAQEVGKIAKSKGVKYLLNASQTVGRLQIDVNAIGCDFLASTGRKWLRGPPGSGFIYVRQEVADSLTPPYIGYVGSYWTGRGDAYEYKPGAERFEVGPGASANALTLGLGSAAEYAMKLGMGEIEAGVNRLIAVIFEELSKIENVEIYGSHDLSKRAYLAINIKGANATLVSQILRNERIIAQSGDFLTNLIPEIIGVDDWIRVAPHYFLTEEDIKRFTDAVRNITRRYKGTMVPKRLGWVGLQKDAQR